MGRAPRLLYEVNTAHWLDALGVGLGAVPAAAWDAIADLGCDAVWLMGVWQRSAAAAEVLRTHPAFASDRAFAGADLEVLPGSAYAVAAWAVEPRFGGEAGLAAARAALAARGMRLFLDWIPNHVAPDHPWARRRALCMYGSLADLAEDPRSFCRVGRSVRACGRDPYFPAWPDTVQLDCASPALQAEAGAALARIAGMCDGVRCDMAMLALPDVIAHTWGDRASPASGRGYWPTVLAQVRAESPDFTVLAEAYWDREADLLACGFDACYDKRLYDALVHQDAAAVRTAAGAVGTVRFLENHDEPRLVTALPDAARRRAAAVVVATLPGTWLFHQGQEHGRRVRAPVTVGRGAGEGDDPELRLWWRRLTRLQRTGAWAMAATSGWPGNPSHEHLLAWTWSAPESRLLVVVNWSAQPAQGRVRLPWPGLEPGPVHLTDPLNGQRFMRDGRELADQGLFVDLAPWAWHVLAVHAP